MALFSGFMYLRPENLKKDFILKRKTTEISSTGTPVSKYMDTGKMVVGTLADSDKYQNDLKKHLWKQDQHTLTHTIVCYEEPKAKKGDVLAMGDRYFLVLLVDDAGGLDIATIYYCEERNDLR